jgi:hypothetical protein
MSQTQYSTKILSMSPRGAIHGELYEGDLLVATFKKPASGWYWGLKMHFGSEAAKTRFDSFTDCLSRGETLEALTEIPTKEQQHHD